MGARAVRGRLGLVGAAAAPGTYLGAADYLGWPHPEVGAPVAAVVFGFGIVASAFLLTWAAEAAQVDLSVGLAIAVLAVLAVLPEYAVDLVFTFRAGQQYAEQGSCEHGGVNPCSLALANMTGANRILVGFGWPLVVLVATVAAVRARRRSATASPGRVALKPVMAVDVVFLGLATLYSLTLPLRSSLTLVDAVVFVGIFAAYVWRLARAPREQPDLAGVAAWVADRRKTARRTGVAVLFGTAALVILATAEHFAENLVATGHALGVDEFLLVQWVAPIASESPELVVACLFAARLKAAESLGTLLSSKVNQWTLLVGTIPIVFALSSGTGHGLPLDDNQRLELLITAAQSLFAVAVLIDLGVTAVGATGLLVLFVVQFAASVTLSAEANRVVFLVLSALYVVLAIGRLVAVRRAAVRTVRDGLTTRLTELDAEPTGRR